MKKPSRDPYRLALAKETVRMLDRSVLPVVTGGDITSTTHPSVLCASVNQAC